MTNMLPTIAPKSDQLNADDLIGRTLTIKVTKVSKADGDQPIAINYVGDNGKPFKPCKSMRRVLVQCWGADGQAYVGRSMTLYRDDSVKFGGVDVGGIRISHLSNIKSKITLALTASRTNRKPFTVNVINESATVDDLPEDIKKAGFEAAEKGVVLYTEWLATLTPEIKEKVRPYHKEWSLIAKEKENDNE